jgi:hypothetical protein
VTRGSRSFSSQRAPALNGRGALVVTYDGRMSLVPSLTAVALPRLFVIGDSISLHYGPYLERLVAGRFTYGRKRAEPSGETVHGRASVRTSSPDAAVRSQNSLDYPDGPFGENAGDSSMVLAYLSARPVTARADLLVLNCGLHDLKVDKLSGRHQVELASYEENLATIVALVHDTGTRLVWCSTTPVDDASHAEHGRDLWFSRSAADVSRYNAAAAEVMRAAGVPIIDLYSVTLALGDQEGGDLAGLYVDHVHLAPWVRAAQAAYIAGWLTGRHAP